MAEVAHDIVILGVFVADTTYRAARQPRMGETVLGQSFALGPGGKGSNQAVAAAMAGLRVGFITRLGQDTFADIAMATWEKAGVRPLVTRDADSYTGAAYIFLEEATGNNAIIVAPGAAATIGPADIEAHADAIAGAKVFVTQLEQPLDAAERGLELARAGGTITILNPAPAAALPDRVLALCDYLTPNETEAETLTGIPVRSVPEATRAAEALLARGVGAVIVTLGENGALYHDGREARHLPAMTLGAVAETTGAGDAFNGGFAAALAEGRSPAEAIRFATALAAISVTRPGTAASMPARAEIDRVLAQTATAGP